MARPIELDPSDTGTGTPGTGTPGDSGYTPPTVAGATLALVVTSTTLTLTSTQIAAAGGPWAHFTVRVTPMNTAGSGLSATFNSGPAITTETGSPITTEDGQTIIQE